MTASTPPRPPDADSAGLRALSLLAGLEPAVRARFLADLTLVWVTPGQMVIEQGEHSEDVWFVLEGALVGLLLSQAGREVAFTEIGPGSYFGELAALDGRPRSITVSAVQRSRLARLAGGGLRRWMAEEPVISRNLALDLADRNRRLTERIYGLVVHDVDTRVRSLLTRLAQSRAQLKPGGMLAPAPTHDAIATHVGANREAVSRVIARLTREGVIDARRQRIVLRDLPALLAGL